MAVAYIKSSWCYTGDRKPAVIVIGVGAGLKKKVVIIVIVVVVVIVVALKVWLILKYYY